MAEIDEVQPGLRAQAAACYALALRIVGDPEVASFVVRDAFVELARSGPTDPMPDAGMSRLLTFTHRRAVAEARLRPDEPADGRVAGSAAILADLAADQNSRADHRPTDIRAALRNLPDSELQILLLAYFDGLSYVDIADRVRLPTSRVRALSASGLQHLMELLGPRLG